MVATTRAADQRLKMAGEATRHSPVLDAASPARSTPRAPRARPQCHVHETQTDAYPPSPSAPVRLHRLTANNSPATTGEPGFAECRRLCRVLNVGHSAKSSLLSARHSAKTGTQQSSLCRVPGTRRRPALGKEPLCRVPGTRQRTTLGKELMGVLAVTFAECPPLGTRQRGFAECQSWALDKA